MSRFPQVGKPLGADVLFRHRNWGPPQLRGSKTAHCSGSFWNLAIPRRSAPNLSKGGSKAASSVETPEGSRLGKTAYPLHPRCRLGLERRLGAGMASLQMGSQRKVLRLAGLEERLSKAVRKAYSRPRRTRVPHKHREREISTSMLASLFLL